MAVQEVRGRCLCGAVTYRATGTPRHLTHCHCESCRRASGAPFVSWATFRAADFQFTGAAPAQFRSSARAVRTFCGTCGTPLTFQLTGAPEEIDITICSLDDPETLHPEDHTWTQRQLSWISLADGLPRHATTAEE